MPQAVRAFRLLLGFLALASLARATELSATYGTYYVTGTVGFSPGTFDRAANNWKYNYYWIVRTYGGGGGSQNGGVHLQMNGYALGGSGGGGGGAGSVTFAPGTTVNWSTYAQAYTGPQVNGDSGSFVVEAAPPVSKQMQVQWRNVSDFTVHVRYKDAVTGKVVYEKDVAPGGALLANIVSNDGHSLTSDLTAQGVSSSLDGSGNLVAGSSTYTWDGSSIDYASMQPLTGSGTTQGVVLGMQLKSSHPANVVDGAPGPEFTDSSDAAKEVSVFNKDETSGTGTLTDGKYFDGVNRLQGSIGSNLRTLGDRIVKKLDNVTTTGSGSGTTDYSSITGNKTLADLHTKLSTINDVLTGSGGRDTAGEAATTSAQSAGISSQMATVNGSMPTIAAAGTASVGSNDEFSFGSVQFMDTTIDIKPYQFAANLSSLAPWIHELLLLSIAVGMVFYVNWKAEMYFHLWWQTPQSQTKVEPVQMFVPAAGWGKQLGMTVTMITALGGAVAATIVFANTAVGPSWSPLSGSVTFGGAMSHSWSVLAGFGAAIGPIWGEMNRWIPIAAFVEAQVACLTITWSMPAIWGVALATAKHFQI